MNKDQVLKAALFTTILILLGNAVAISRDYQDSWILEGLEIPFLLFVVALTLTFFSEKRVSWLVVLAIVGRIVFLLIPNLKYVWFQGVYIDQHTQYGLADYVVATGRISASNPTAPYYASPLFHLLFSIFSIVLDVPVVNSMKYVPVLFSPIYPLLTYAIVKKMELTHEKTILKYALFLSTVPISMEQYEVVGTMFGILLAFMILFLLVVILKNNDRRYWPICIILVIALAAAHSVTSVVLTGLLLMILALQRVPYFRLKYYLRVSVVLTVVAISLAWLMFSGYSTLQAILRLLFISVPSGATPTSEYIPSTFFELARVDILAAAKTFLAYYGEDLFLLILVLAGLLIMLRMRKKNNVGGVLMLFCGLVLVFMLLGNFLKLGATRELAFERLLVPVFSSIAVFYMGNKRKWIRPIIFASILLLATLQVYACQPLIPSANVLHKDLPASVPIGYVNDVNSIYQRQVVGFALSHFVVGVIACDSITYNQIFGVADYNFMMANVIDYYPIDKQQPQQGYDLFIIHVPGKAGVLGEKAYVRTPDLILSTVYNSSVVYTNGESYVLAHHYPQP